MALAVSVIFWHSFPLTGHKEMCDRAALLCEPARQLMEQVGVDGFFTVSGFLITASWFRHPQLREFAIARGLRIFPGLWVCVLIIAFVMAPLSVLIQGGSVRNLMSTSAPIEYVINEGLMNVNYPGIAGTPKGVPVAGVWNGSLWTLFFEVLCYVVVAVLGVIGLLKRHWTIPALFALSTLGAFAVGYPTFEPMNFIQVLARFFLVFAAGAMIYQYQHVLPARWTWVGVSALIVVASAFMPNYRLIGAVFLAYAIITSGALIRNPRLNLRNDLSYGTYIYAFPTQQLLAVLGFVGLGPFLFFPLAAVATVPLAAFSWFVVEKRAMALRHRLTRKRTLTAPAT